MSKILIIEDDLCIADELMAWLLHERHTVDLSKTAEDGIFRLSHFDYDMAVVD